MALKFGNENALLSKGIIDFYLPNPKCMDGICNGATELCKRYCYGNGVFRHSEKPNNEMLNTEVIARENYEITKSHDFVDQMNDLIAKSGEIKRIRIHSIGDFYDYDYFLKWISIMNANKGIQFTAYVKNFDVLQQYMKNKKQVPDNFNVLLSLYPDTYDHYEAKGGKKYIDGLFDEIIRYFNAKKYIVCSREFFHSEIEKKKPDKIFCNGGTQMLCDFYGLESKKYEGLFVPGQGCDDCLKCYSNEKCPPGSEIYAVLRASSKLANLETFLKKAHKSEYTCLRDMYKKKI